MIKVMFKYSTMAGRIYDIHDEILNEEVEEMAVTDPEKAVFLPALSHLGRGLTEHRPQVHTVGEASPTVFLLTSGNMRTLPQALRAASRLDYLGFRIVAVQGVANKDELHSQGVPKKAHAGHMAWLLAFLPKLISLVQDLLNLASSWWQKILVGLLPAQHQRPYWRSVKNMRGNASGLDTALARATASCQCAE